MLSLKESLTGKRLLTILLLSKVSGYDESKREPEPLPLSEPEDDPDAKPEPVPDCLSLTLNSRA